MAEYIVSSDDQLSESLLVLYRNERVATQTVVAGVHRAIANAFAAEDRFNELVAEGGPLADLAVYHAAKISPLTASLDALRTGMVQVKTAMEALEEAVPGLFPGVTR